MLQQYPHILEVAHVESRDTKGKPKEHFTVFPKAKLQA